MTARCAEAVRDGIEADGARGGRAIIKLERWAPRRLTHYDTLGVDATAAPDKIIAAASAPRTSPLGSEARAAAAALAEVDFHRTWETCCRARFRE